MGFSISKAFKSVTKPISKVVSSIGSSAKKIAGTVLTGGLDQVAKSGIQALPFLSGGSLGGSLGGIWDTLKGLGGTALDFYNENKGVLDSVTSAAGQYYGYQQSKEGLEQQNKNAISNAKTQMDFQERMAGSAHQREIADLRAAGLNPILSGTGGMGAATPAGSQAPSYNEGEAVSSAFTAFAQMAQAFKAQAEATQIDKLTDPRVSNVKADTHLKYQDTILKGSQILINKQQLPILKQTLSNLQLINQQIQSSTKLTNAQKDKALAEVRVLGQTLKTATMKGEIDASDLGTALEIGKRISTIVGDVPGLSNLIKTFKSVGKK